MSIELIFFLIALAFVAEFIDSSMGMMYGTILSPVLIVSGFDPLVVIPSILFSQGVAGFIAGISHHKFSNADFKPKITCPKKIVGKIKKHGFVESFKRGFSRDFKIVFVVSVLGVVVTIIAVLLAISLPKWVLTTYIGILVLSMGIVLLSKLKFKFTWKKILGIAILSSFNKGLSGGGFGPVVTSGQVIAGNNSKNSIATTTMSETPICITGFAAYFLTVGFSDWTFLFILMFGAVMAAPLGAHFTSKMNEEKIRPLLGVLAVGLGVWTLAKVFF